MPSEHSAEQEIESLKRKVPALLKKAQEMTIFADSLDNPTISSRFDSTKNPTPVNVNRKLAFIGTTRDCIARKTIPTLQIYSNLYGFKLRLLEAQLQGADWAGEVPNLLAAVKDYFIIQGSAQLSDQHKEIARQNTLRVLGFQAFALLWEQETEDELKPIVIDAQGWIKKIRNIPLQLSEEEITQLREQSLPPFIVDKRNLKRVKVPVWIGSSSKPIYEDVLFFREVELLRLPPGVKNTLIRGGFTDIRAIDEASNEALLKNSRGLGPIGLSYIRPAILEFKAKLQLYQQGQI